MGINLRVPQNSVKVDGRNSSIYLTQNAIKGDDGGYYIPSIDSEGNLTWAPSETEMPAVGGTNIKGPKGDSGVWVGTETPDGDYNVWVKPDDEAIEIATKADLDGKQDKLTAGTNITIENNVISAAGGGSDEVWIGSEEPTGDQTVWIDPTGSETAGLVTQAELANKQDKLTAGTNITIDSNNVISATGGGGSYTLPVAGQGVLGGVKIESSLASRSDGVPVRMDNNNYLYIGIPTSNDPGVMRPSGTLTVNPAGVLSLGVPAKRNGKYVLVGGVKPDGTTITMTSDGTISASAPPTATTSTLGLVKPDGTSITIADGVISSIQPTKTSELTNDSDFITSEYHDPAKQNKLVAGDNITIADDGTISASHPARYVDGANATENTLKLYFSDNTSVNFTPTGGSGGSSGVSGYAFSSTQTFTDVDKAHLKEIYNNKNIYMTIDYITVVRIMSLGSRWGFVVINTNGATSNQVLVYTIDLDRSGNITSNTFTLFMSYYLAGNSSALNGDIITSENWSQYIGGGDWIGPTIDQSISDLYNVKQLWIIYQGNNTGAIMQSVLRFDYDSMASTLGGRAYSTFYLHHDDVTSNQVYIDYDGANLNISGGNILGYFYKT